MRESVSGHAPSEREAPLPRPLPRGSALTYAEGVPTPIRRRTEGEGNTRPRCAVG